VQQCWNESQPSAAAAAGHAWIVSMAILRESVCVVPWSVSVVYPNVCEPDWHW
jgi:hypothetical protein